MPEEQHISPIVLRRTTVAKKLGISSRTLTRWIESPGTDFQRALRAAMLPRKSTHESALFVAAAISAALEGVPQSTESRRCKKEGGSE